MRRTKQFLSYDTPDYSWGYSASGCLSGAALAQAGRATQLASKALRAGNRERPQLKRRALASCGTRQISAKVGVSPKQNLLRLGADTTISSRFDKPRSIQ